MGSVTTIIKAKSGVTYVYEATLTPVAGTAQEDVKIGASIDLLNFNANLKQVIVQV